MCLHSPRALLALLVLSCAFPTAACGDPRVDGQRIHTVTKGIAHFSFQYSDKYVKSGGENLEQFSSVYFDRTYEEADSFTLFYIVVSKAGVYAEGAQVYLEQELSSAQESYMDFKLLYVSGREVAGLLGTQLVYTYTRRRAPDWPSPKATGAVVKEVFFESDGLIWKVGLNAFDKTAIADMADFDHVLATFKILD
jgi:hypothetical protein